MRVAYFTAILALTTSAAMAQPVIIPLEKQPERPAPEQQTPVASAPPVAPPEAGPSAGPSGFAEQSPQPGAADSAPAPDAAPKQ